MTGSVIWASYIQCRNHLNNAIEKNEHEFIETNRMSIQDIVNLHYRLTSAQCSPLPIQSSTSATLARPSSSLGHPIWSTSQPTMPASCRMLGSVVVYTQYHLFKYIVSASSPLPLAHPILLSLYRPAAHPNACFSTTSLLSKE